MSCRTDLRPIYTPYLSIRPDRLVGAAYLCTAPMQTISNNNITP